MSQKPINRLTAGVNVVNDTLDSASNITLVLYGDNLSPQPEPSQPLYNANDLISITVTGKVGP